MLIESYQRRLGTSRISEVLDLFFESIVDTNRSHQFYVDWVKVKNFVEKFKVECHILNSLIGSKNFDADLKEILERYPEILPVIPTLIAVHDLQFKVIQDFEDVDINIINYDFRERRLSRAEIDLILDFFKKTGLKNLFQYPVFTNVTDYLLGVEVGMDTNARKNRSGSAMEDMLAPIIATIKAEYSLPFEILAQKQFKKLKKYGMRVNSDIANRKADFILVDKQSKRTVNIEANFYTGTGSKPQEIVDSYITRQQELKQNGINFIWISDGGAWKGQKNQMQKGFEKIDYLLNLYFVKHGVLDEILRSIFG